MESWNLGILESWNLAYFKSISQLGCVLSHIEYNLKVNKSALNIKIIFITCILFFKFISIFSQIPDPYIYVCGGYANNPNITASALQKIDYRDNSIITLAETPGLTDIAFHPDGRLFGCVSANIYQLDTTGFVWPVLALDTLFEGDITKYYFSGMTFDQTGLMWLCGHNSFGNMLAIFSYDISNKILIEHFLYSFDYGYVDIEWYDGELYVIGYELPITEMITLTKINLLYSGDREVDLFPQFDNIKSWGLVAVNDVCQSKQLFSTHGTNYWDTRGLFVFNETLDAITYTSIPSMCAATGATSRTSWLGSYTPLGIDSIEVNSQNNNCSPPFSITAHTKKGYYMRPDIQYSLDGITYQQDSEFNNLLPGKYVVHVRDSFGCYKMTDSIELKINSFNHQSTAVTDYCGLGMGSALITVPSGSALSEDGINFVADSLHLDGLTAGIYTYYVRNASGCYDTSSLVIQDAPPFTVDLSVLADTCGRGIGTILATPSGQSGPIRLSTDGVLFEPISVLSGLNSGMYSIWIKDSLGCTVQQQVRLDNVGGVEWKNIDVLPPNCFADDGEIHASAEGEGLVYTLNGVSNATGLFSGLASGFYTLSIQDQYHCSMDTVIQLKGSNAPIATIEQLFPATCEMNNGSIQAVLSPDEQYSVDGINYGSNGVFTGLSEGDYTLYVLNTDGCKDSTTFHITQTGSPTIETVETSPDSCETQSGRLEVLAKGIEPFTYMLNGDTINHFGTFTHLASGAYTVTVIDSLGCITARSIQIDNIGTPMTEYVVNVLPLKCGESEYIFSTQDVYIEHLTPSSDGYYHLKPGDYQITYLMYDCDNVRAVTLPAPICDPFIPNAFSPNGDGINDEFKVSGSIQVVEMRIFDRWGGCLYTSFDANTGWDGSYRGHLVQPGVYVYWIKIKLSDGSIKLFKGDVTVMR